MTGLLGRSVAALRVRNFRLFFGGQVVSQIGNWVDTIAQAWLVLVLTDSGTALGIAAAARYLPVMLLGPWGGVVTDRMDKRRLLLVTQTLACAVAATLWIVVSTGVVTIEMVYVLSLCTGFINVFDFPARQTVIVEMVGTDRLHNAISLNSIVVNLARIVGPSVAAGLIGLAGPALCFGVNALSYVVVLVMLALLRPQEMTRSARAPRTRRQLRDGIGYLFREPGLRTPFLLVAIAGIFAWEYQVTLPLLAQAGLRAGPDAIAWMFSSMGAGAIIGGFVTATATRTTVRGLLNTGLAWGVAMLAVASGPNLALICVALVAVGYTNISFNAIAKTQLQVNAEPMMRGRVMALWATAWAGSTAVGGPLVGWVGQQFGARWSVAIGGVATIAASLTVYIARSRRRRRAPIPTPALPTHRQGDDGGDQQRADHPGPDAGLPVKD